MVKVAQEENDNATPQMLQWFVEEQVEEEANTDEMAFNLRIVGDDGRGILMVDREAGARTFVPPTPPHNPPAGQAKYEIGRSHLRKTLTGGGKG